MGIDVSIPEIRAGVHEMECVEALRKRNKADDKTMMRLTWVDENGNQLWDYLIYEHDDGSAPRQGKFKSFFRAIGRTDTKINDSYANDEGHFEEFEGLKALLDIREVTPVDKITGAIGYPTPEIKGYMQRG